MIKIEITKVKKRGIIPIIISGAAVLVILAVVLGIFIAKKTARTRALAALDVENEQTVISAMKYVSQDKDKVLEIARMYADAQMPSDAVRLAVYAIEYLGAVDEGCRLLEDIGAGEQFTAQLRGGEIMLSEFEVCTQYGDDGYGIADGIYASFLGGYAKAKISAALPLDIYAYDSGAYFLDSSDRLIKSISRDGREVKVIINQKAREFIFHGRQVYYIDEQGLAHGSEDIALQGGEFAAGFFIDGDDVKCTVYDKDYRAVRVITVK